MGAEKFRWELFTKTKRLVDRGIFGVPEGLGQLRCFANGIQAYLEDGVLP